MQTFPAKRVDEIEVPPTPGVGVGWSRPMRAPGRIVMVVKEGSCWVRRDGGSPKELAAQSVVIWEPGEQVEYRIGNEGGKIENYWSEDFSEDEWNALYAEVFGQEAVG